MLWGGGGGGGGQNHAPQIIMKFGTDNNSGNLSLHVNV